MTDTEKAKLKGFFDRLIEHGELKTDGSQFYIKKVFDDRYDLGLSRSDPYMGKLGHVLEIASNDIETAKPVKRYRVINSREEVVLRLLQNGYKLTDNYYISNKCNSYRLSELCRFIGKEVKKNHSGHFFIEERPNDISVYRHHFDPIIVEEYEA